MTTADDLMRTAFDAYNRQDAATLLTLVTEDVLWPGDEGMLRGKDELRAFWKRQWAETKTHDEVLAVQTREAGYVVVDLSQKVHAIDGTPISSARLRYGFVVKGGLIRRLQTRQA